MEKILGIDNKIKKNKERRESNRDLQTDKVTRKSTRKFSKKDLKISRSNSISALNIKDKMTLWIQHGKK